MYSEIITFILCSLPTSILLARMEKRWAMMRISGDEEDGPEEMDGGGDLSVEVRKSCPLVQVFLEKSRS